MGIHRDCGQAEAGGPALGAPGKALQGVLRQRAAVPGHELPGFGDGESKLAGADLGQLAGQPVAVQWQRVHPGGDQQAQARPCVPQHVVKPVQHRGVGQQMQVIQDQRHRRVLGRQCRR